MTFRQAVAVGVVVGLIVGLFLSFAPRLDDAPSPRLTRPAPTPTVAALPTPDTYAVLGVHGGIQQTGRAVRVRRGQRRRAGPCGRRDWPEPP